MAAATAAATAATNATAGRRRTAVPRAPPELPSYKTRFNAYLQHIGLPSVDDLTPEDVASPGDIESIMCSWAEYMSTNPPRYIEGFGGIQCKNNMPPRDSATAIGCKDPKCNISTIGGFWCW